MKQHLLWIALIAVGCGSGREEPHDADVAEELSVTLGEQKRELVSDVERELAELELAIGDLREDADDMEEDFTAELVHLDDLIEAIESRVNEAEIETMDELEALRAETRRHLDEVNETYTALKVRVDAAGRATDG